MIDKISNDASGFGRTFTSDGSSFIDAYFKNNIRNGFHREIDNTGRHFTGQYVNGLREGVHLQYGVNG